MDQNGDKMKIEYYDDPFPHFIIDDFVDVEIAKKLSEEFIPFDSKEWFVYDSPLEVKKALNDWYHFPPETYQFFQYLNSPEFLNSLIDLTGIDLVPDHGLHGAGWHIQGNGGKLNVHQDYSLHPKLDLQRKFNLIYYLTPDWEEQWGGNLELWSHDDETNSPKECVKVLENKFNRVVLFDASQNSWHGFSKTISCPEDKYRKSIAMYYLTTPPENVSQRRRALYAPTEEQKNDPEIMELIKRRTAL